MSYDKGRAKRTGAHKRSVGQLQQRISDLEFACSKSNEEICQTLGKALGYPWFKDDPKNFPNATEADGVCVGDHVAETLAEEAARRIEQLEAKLERIKNGYGVNYTSSWVRDQFT